MFTSSTFTALALAGLLAAAPAGAQNLGHFLQISGIDGDSTDRDHRDWIDTFAWSWGVHQELDAGGKPQAQFDPFAWQQGVDSSVVPLFLGVAQGASFEQATLDVTHRDGESSAVFFQMVFANVKPVSLQMSNGSDVAAALRYDAVTMRYNDGRGWTEGSFSLGTQGVGFSGDPNVLTGLLQAGGKVSLDIGALPPPVPEPSSLALMLGGLTATALRLRRRVPTQKGK
jgi:type VI protein secretion system component Hcp